jgi:hypothetical protein
MSRTAGSKSWCAGACALSVLVWSCARGGSSEDSVETGATQRGRTPLGEAATTEHYRMTVHTVRDCEPHGYLGPKRGYKKVGAEVTIEAKSSQQIPVNPFYAKVTDGSGRVYRTTFSGCEPQLKSRQLTAGTAARGFISFELPEHARGLVLTYAPLLPGTKGKELSFDLGR